MTEAASGSPPVQGRRIPVGGERNKDTGLFAVRLLILSEAALFGYLLFSYAFTASQQPHLAPTQPPDLKLALPNTLLLLASSGVVAWAERQARNGHALSAIIGFCVTWLMGAAFLGVQLLEWRNKSFSLTSSNYGAFYFTITGFHMAHVIAGLLAFSIVIFWLARGYFDQHRHTPVLASALYWHFVDAVWVVVFAAFYLAPRLMG